MAGPGDIFGSLFGTNVPPPSTQQTPGALNGGWDLYFQWADKQHGGFAKAFEYAEAKRQIEDMRWLNYYKTVYERDYAWWKKMILLVLNGIQLWALWRQFRDQKDLADKTWDIADRMQRIAEEMFDFYLKHYRPHEVALSKQIDDYFNKPECIDYDGLGNQFSENMRNAFSRVKADLFRCNSQICGVATLVNIHNIEMHMAQAVGNARTGAFRYGELVKEYRDDKWLDYRFKLIQIGRNVSEQGQAGLAKAFNTFSSFGADPGAALGQLLGTLSNTVGGMITGPVSPTGKIDLESNPLSSVPYYPFLSSVKQTGDVHIGKNTKRYSN